MMLLAFVPDFLLDLWAIFSELVHFYSTSFQINNDTSSQGIPKMPQCQTKPDTTLTKGKKGHQD
jgi:hypothetical protein